MTRITTDQLPRALEKPLSPAWLLAGDEPLLIGEAADDIRARARAEGYSGRELFITDRSFDWSELLASSQSLSLFSERRKQASTSSNDQPLHPICDQPS